MPVDTIEAARSVGATRLQLLVQVRIPMARTSILAGLNQTVLYAISMATIAALIGASGLGQPVWSALNRLEFGQALEPGIAIVLLAVILDRTTQRIAQRSRRNLVHADGQDESSSRVWALVRKHRFDLGVGVLVIVFGLVAQAVPALLFANFSRPPSWLEVELRDPVNDFVTWVTVEFGTLLEGINDAVQARLLNPMTDVLVWIPWPAVIASGFVAGFLAMRWRGALLVPGAIFAIGAIGMWTYAIETIVVVALSAVVSILVGFPVGVLMSRSNAVAAALRPFLDLMQTLPVFLFVIPTVVFLGSGPVAGSLATVAYALPPMIRYTNVALRDADPDVVEAATSAGASRRQLLWHVRVPLGLPTIMVGVNQTILLALAMAVVSAFIGTPGLGQELLASVAQANLGRSVEAGFSMFLLAVVADRVLTGITGRIGTSRRAAGT